MLFLLLWLSCKFSWALVGVLPFFLRCALAQVGLPPREPWKQWAFSGAVVALVADSMRLDLAEIVERKFAEMDFQLKQQALQFREFLGDVQEIRGGVRDARHRSGT